MLRKSIARLDYPLVAAALLAAFLNMFGIWKDHTVNAYYTAAVTSMLQSFHNFFFASFDPAGFVTVDKPPVTFWVQTASAWLFGLHGWSVILPQALAGVGSVLLMYVLVKSSFGRTAARLASLVFACTPIAAAVARTNNVDSLLVFTLLLGTWMLFRGIRRGKLGWVIAAFGIIGLAFNEKMLQAYMVVPAFILFYAIAARANWKKKLCGLAAATAVLVAVSLSWPLAVDSISKDKRPYEGSSQTNSVLELAFGYNGVSRLTGMQGGGPQGGPPGMNGGATAQQGASGANGAPNGGGTSAAQGAPGTDGAMPGGPGMQGGGFAGPGGQGGPPGGFGGPMDGSRGGGMFNTGTPGPLRLFQTELSGQISWLLPFALFGAVALLAGVRRRKPLSAKEQESLFWLAWLLPVAGFFSVAGFFHQYYLIMLAAPIAALCAAGWTEMRQQYSERSGWTRWLLPAGLLAATGFQLVILSDYTSQIGYLWSIAIGIAGSASALVLALQAGKERLGRIAAMSGILILLAAPLYWAATPLLYGGNSHLPEAGPQLQSPAQGPGGGRGGMGEDSVNEQLLSYVTEHNTGETYLFATTNATTAAPYIIETGKAVMAMGGYSGSDPILTLDKLKELVNSGQVKFFLLGGGGRGGTSTGITDWIKANSTEVPEDQWNSNSNSTDGGQRQSMGMGMGSSVLYEINTDRTQS